MYLYFSSVYQTDGPSVYINLPVCLIAFIVLAPSLRGVEFQRTEDSGWQTFIQRFDFVGL